MTEEDRDKEQSGSSFERVINALTFRLQAIETALRGSWRRWWVDAVFSILAVVLLAIIAFNLTIIVVTKYLAGDLSDMRNKLDVVEKRLIVLDQQNRDMHNEHKSIEDEIKK